MLNEQSNERVLFSGYAKLPVGITAHWRLNWHGNILRSALLVTIFPMGTKSCRIF